MLPPDMDGASPQAQPDPASLVVTIPLVALWALASPDRIEPPIACFGADCAGSCRPLGRRRLPGWVELVLIDAEACSWHLVDKVPVFGDDRLSAERRIPSKYALSAM